jgi:hypothetical protein
LIFAGVCPEAFEARAVQHTRWMAIPLKQAVSQGIGYQGKRVICLARAREKRTRILAGPAFPGLEVLRVQVRQVH